MYIEPQTTLKILKNVPLDEGYKNTIYFANASAQVAYFAGKVKHTIASSTYQRINKGVVRVPVNAEGLYDCNYIMFQNASFGTKWFYAFVTKVEYVNTEMSEVSFEIDVMQTWFFDYEMKPSFVEREHDELDIIGDNLIPEDLETGNIIYNGEECFFGRNGYNEPIIVWANALYASGDPEYPGSIRSNVYSGVRYKKYTFAELGMLQDDLFMAQSAGLADSTVAIFMIYPEMWVDENDPSTPYEKFVSRNTTIDGYTPRNNKLFTYPYNYLTVSNSLGETMDFKWELFSNKNEAQFDILSALSPNPEVILFPKEYREQDGGVFNNRSVTEKMSLNGFPQCPYIVDTYRAWLAQNSNSVATNLLVGALAGAGSATFTKGNPELAVAGGVYAVASTVANIKDKSHLPTVSRGGTGVNGMFAFAGLDFYFFKMSVTADFARMIDDYWDRFGYPCKKVKIPNISDRPEWNYVKTIDCTIVGSMPSDDIKKVCEIYDKGVTFWKNPDHVGNYALSNKP